MYLPYGRDKRAALHPEDDSAWPSSYGCRHRRHYKPCQWSTQAMPLSLAWSADFDRHLEVLWDVLTTDIAGPVKVVWEHATASREAMGEDFDRVADLLKHVALERDDFQVCFQWVA